MDRLRRARLIKSLESLERLQKEEVDETRQELAQAQLVIIQIQEQIKGLETEYTRQKEALLTMTLEEKMTFTGYADRYALEKERLAKQLEQEEQAAEKIREDLREKYRDQRIVQKALNKRYEETHYELYLDERKTLDEAATHLYHRQGKE